MVAEVSNTAQTQTKGRTKTDVIIVRAILVMFIILFYLNLPISLGGGTELAAGWSVMCGIMLFLLNMNRIRKTELLIIFVILAICLCSVLFNAGVWDNRSWQRYLTENIKALILFACTLGAFYGVYLEVTRYDVRVLNRFFGIVAVGLIVGAALEVYTPLRQVSDAFRHAVYDHGVQSGDIRDLVIAGHARPRFFTSETSFLAMNCLIAILSWTVTSGRNTRFVIAAGLLASAYLFVRSPILVLGFFAVAGLLADDLISRHGLKRGLVIGLACALVVIPVLLAAIPLMLSDRLEQYSAGGDVSSMLRTTGPYLITLQVLADYPALGLGFGAKETAEAYANRVFFDMGILQHVPRRAPLGNNSFATWFLQLGLIGGFFFFAVCLRAIHVFGRQHYFFLFAAIFAVMNSVGSNHTAKFWGPIVIWLAVSRVAAEGQRIGRAATGTQRRPSSVDTGGPSPAAPLPPIRPGPIGAE